MLRFVVPAGLVIAAATFAAYAMAHTYLGASMEMARSAATVSRSTQRYAHLAVGTLADATGKIGRRAA